MHLIPTLKRVSSKHQDQLAVIVLACFLFLLVLTPWMIARWLAFLSWAVLVTSVAVLCIRRKIWPRQLAWELWAVYRVERSLLLADVIWQEIAHEAKGRALCRLPEVSVKQSDDCTLTVRVRNSLKYQEKLLEMDLSPALDGWVTDTVRFNEDRSWVVFQMVRQGADLAYRFDNMQALGDFLDARKKSRKIPLDKLRSLKADAHTLVAGLTGSGKSIALVYLFLYYVRKRWIVGVIDPKTSDLYKLGQAFGARVVSDSQAVQMVEEYVAILEKRKAELRDGPSFMKTALDLGYPGVVLVVDEYASLVGKLEKSQRLAFESKVRTLVLEGRQLGVFVVLAMQQAHSDNVSTQIRENLANVVVLGASGEQTYRTAFGNLASQSLRGVEVLPGTGFAMTEGSTEPVFVRMPWLGREFEEDLAEFILRKRKQRLEKARKEKMAEPGLVDKV